MLIKKEKGCIGSLSLSSSPSQLFQDMGPCVIHNRVSRTEKHSENSVSHIETQPESGSLLSEQKLRFPPSSLPAGAKHLGERD